MNFLIHVDDSAEGGAMITALRKVSLGISGVTRVIAGIEAAEIKTEYGTDEEETTQELTNNTAEQVATDE